MRYIYLLLICLYLSCSSADQRIKEYSYTNEWYYYKSAHYQVYKTKTNRKYIIVINKNETRLKRYYFIKE